MSFKDRYKWIYPLSNKDLSQVAPKTNYHSKYEHLIGLDSALDAAKKTETNAQYGMVSAEQKKDRRTVEDIQAELRAKKKQKVEHNV